MIEALTPEGRFAALKQCADLGFTPEQAANHMRVHVDKIYPVAHVLGLKFKNASIGNRNGTGGYHRPAPRTILAGDDP